MPIYEYFCGDNRKIYRFYARTLAMAAKTPRCPDNLEFKMERMISQFAFIGRAKEPSTEPAGGGEMDDPRMEAAMLEMEREFSGMSEENPDPKQLARMMRRMSTLTGEAFPEAVDEMIARMEKGEDPEKLEEEYGDALGGMEGEEEGGGMPGMGGAGGPGGAEKEPGGALAATLRRLRKPAIARDPKLYEMRDYVSENALPGS